MKKIITIASAAILMVGCTTTQQTTAYNTIGATEATAKAAFDAYSTLIINGTVSTNSLPEVSEAYNQLQADALLAASVASQGTNALATTNLLTDLTQLTSIINTANSIK